MWCRSSSKGRNEGNRQAGERDVSFRPLATDKVYEVSLGINYEIAAPVISS
ncbi:hypothetical protein ABIA23_001434 [Sinorhizobium fredii]